ISAGVKENKIGIDIAYASRGYARSASLPNLEVQGVDCPIRSQLTTVAPFLDAHDRELGLSDRLAEQGIQIRHLDMGGGLGVTYNQEQPPQPAEYVKAVAERMGDRNLELILEPGRSIAANAGILVTRVEFLKCTEHRNFAIIDAAMNDL